MASRPNRVEVPEGIRKAARSEVTGGSSDRAARAPANAGAGWPRRARSVRDQCGLGSGSACSYVAVAVFGEMNSVAASASASSPAQA